MLLLFVIDTLQGDFGGENTEEEATVFPAHISSNRLLWPLNIFVDDEDGDVVLDKDPDVDLTVGEDVSDVIDDCDGLGTITDTG